MAAAVAGTHVFEPGVAEGRSRCEAALPRLMRDQRRCRCAGRVAQRSRGSVEADVGYVRGASKIEEGAE